MSDAYTEFSPLKFDQREIAQRGYGSASAGATDDRLIVGFYRRSVVNVFRSQAEGKRICEDKDYVKIQHPGETLNIVDRPVQESDKNRWPRQWGMFSQGKQQVPDGIPITLLYPDKPSITDMLIGYNIHTVEQLANLSANGVQTVGMGCQEWVNKAAKYLERAENGVGFHKFEQEIAKKDTEIATLQRQLRELTATVNSMMVPKNPQNFDVQTSMIANMKGQEEFSPAPKQFSNSIMSPDLSGEVRPRKQRSDKGQPRGSRKEA